LAKVMARVLLASMALVCAALVGGRLVPDGGELAYVTARDGNFEVYLLDINTTLTYNLSRNSSRDDSPSWSPDGERLAFVSYRDGNAQVYTADPSTGAIQPITTAKANNLNPTWSPDGSQLAYVSNSGGQWLIYVVDADCSRDCDAQKRALRASFPAGRNTFGRVAWSPDGVTIGATISVPGGGMAIHLIDVATGDLTTLNTSLIDTRLSWSADSRRILYASIFDRNTEVYAVDVHSGEAHNLSQTGSHDGTPSWSPDSQQVVFESNRNGTSEIYRSDAAGGVVQQLTTLGSSSRPLWSPDGEWVLFESKQEGDFDIYVIRTDGSGLRRLTHGGSDDRLAVWRPGG
jgi:Tol biopolymer transport system component